MLSLISFINRAGSMVAVYLVVFLKKRYGAEEATASATVFAVGAAALAAAPWAGRWTDRVGAARVISFSLLSSGIALTLVPWMPDVLLAGACLVAYSALAELLRPATLAAIVEIAPPELRRSAYALHRVAVNLAIAVGSAAGGYLAAWNVDAIFWVDGGTSLLAFAAFAAAPFGLRAAAPRTAAAEGPVMPVDVLRDASLTAPLAALLPSLAVFFLILSPLTHDLVHQRGRPESFVGGLFVINTLLVVATELPINAVTARWRPSRAVGLGAFVMAAGFAMYGVGVGGPRETEWLVAGTVVWTFGEIVLFPAASDYVARIAPPSRRGAYMGWYSVAFNLAHTAGPALGLLVLKERAAPTLWIGGGLLAAASAIGTAAVMRRIERAPPPAPEPDPELQPLA